MYPKEILYAGKFINLVREGRWEYSERKATVTGIVAIVAFTPQREVILVEQERIPCHGRVIEFPAGLVGDKVGLANESLEDAAHREFMEETGYRAKRFRYLTEGPVSAGMTSEVISIFLAEEVEKVGLGGGDSTESIVTHLVPFKDIDTWLEQKRREGVQVDMKVYSGLYFLQKVWPD